MKNFFICIILSVALLQVENCSAQTLEGDAPSKDLKEKIITQLGFPNPLADYIISVKRDFRQVILHIRINQGLNPEDKKVLFKGVEMQMDEKLLAVLGNEKFKKFKDWDSKNWWRLE
jgi:hypothetical protein